MRIELKEIIQQYLYYGYLPNQGHFRRCEGSVRANYKSLHTPKGAAEVLDDCVDELLQNAALNGSVVVPISGGWDSRILLGAAMERFEIGQIKTLSFGVPGQLDFDIGAQIAGKCGLEHHAFDLSKVELSWGDLLTSVEESPWTYVPDGYFNRLAVSQVANSPNDVVLSGFMGDPLTGGHLSNSDTPTEALDEFTGKQRREKKLWLPLPGFDPQKALGDIAPQEDLSYSELLDFEIRQASCIAPIVTPQRFWADWGGDMGSMSSTGAKVLAPFVHPKWAAYWFSVPDDLKAGQKLYLDMMTYKFPDLAAMPSKYSLGTATRASFLIERVKSKGINLIGRALPQLGVRYDKSLNYIDFARAFREREDYQHILNAAITYLEARQVAPWLDFHKIKKLHMSSRKNYENALLVIVGLALNLEAEAAS